MLQSLVIELGRGILPTNILTKYDDYTMKTIEVIERTNALDTAHRMCSHNMSWFFFKRAYKKYCTKYVQKKLVTCSGKIYMHKHY